VSLHETVKTLGRGPTILRDSFPQAAKSNSEFSPAKKDGIQSASPEGFWTKPWGSGAVHCVGEKKATPHLLPPFAVISLFVFPCFQIPGFLILKTVKSTKSSLFKRFLFGPPQVLTPWPETRMVKKSDAPGHLQPLQFKTPIRGLPTARLLFFFFLLPRASTILVFLDTPNLSTPTGPSLRASSRVGGGGQWKKRLDLWGKAFCCLACDCWGKVRIWRWGWKLAQKIRWPLGFCGPEAHL